MAISVSCWVVVFSKTWRLKWITTYPELRLVWLLTGCIFSTQTLPMGQSPHPLEAFMTYRPRRPRIDALKEFGCDVPGCGKRFYHLRNLRHHQKEKHGIPAPQSTKGTRRDSVHTSQSGGSPAEGNIHDFAPSNAAPNNDHPSYTAGISGLDNNGLPDSWLW